MNAMKAVVVAAMLVVSTGVAMAGEAHDQQVEAATVDSTVDGSGQDGDVQAYCYWQTYCDFYGYCWTNWVCF